jgi:hypothetical protein
MATVYRTYMDLADLSTSGALALLLTFFELPTVFLASALSAFALAGIARYLPRRM